MRGEPVTMIMPTMRSRQRWWQHALYYADQQAAFSHWEMSLIVGCDDDADADEVRELAGLMNMRIAVEVVVCRDRDWARKANQLMETARTRVVVHWEDDDYHAPHRVASLMRRWEHTPGPSLVGQRSIPVYCRDGVWRTVTVPLAEGRLCHGTILGDRSLWLREPYKTTDGEWQSRIPRSWIHAVEDRGVPGLEDMRRGTRPDHLPGARDDWTAGFGPAYAAIHHGGNTWVPDYAPPVWAPCAPVEGARNSVDEVSL